MRKEVIGNHTIYYGDCLEVMAELKDKSIDLVLTDPPYGIGADKKAFQAGGRNGWREWEEYTDWDKKSPEKIYFDELRRISKKQVIWGGNYFSDFLPPSQGWYVWDKGQRNFSLADGELAWTSYDRALRIFEFSRAKALQDVKEHPTQKPVELFEWCLNKSPECKLIFDGFAGSRTTCVASERLERASIAVEVSLKNFDISCRRTEMEVKQPKLFAVEKEYEQIGMDLTDK